MHDYAVFGHDRTTVGRWLGVTSIILSGGIAQLFALANEITGFDAFTKASITTGLIYFTLHWAFNKWIWRLTFFEVPNINGTWDIVGRTLNEDGSTRYNWSGTIGIEQNWKQILINLNTGNSQSDSYTATLSKRNGPTGGWRLSYSYRNEPELEQIHELNPHKGYCEIDFNKELTIGKASYFNSAGRRTFGVIDLQRKQK